MSLTNRLIRKLRVYFNQQMHMICHYLDFDVSVKRIHPGRPIWYRPGSTETE